MKLKLAAIKVLRNGGCDDAWFYENAKSIDVYVCRKGQDMSCRIPRAYLEDYLKRTKPRAK